MNLAQTDFRQDPRSRLDLKLMNVWVVEDESKVLQFLESALRGEGHSVSACATFEDAQALMLDCEVKGDAPDAVVLDRMLNNGKDGINLIRPIKQKFPQTKIIILSAINTPDEKAAALDQGADDYLSKPFSLVELSARLRVLGRRSQEPAVGDSHKLRHKDVEMDLLAHHVHVAGRRIDFSNKEFALLRLFLQNPGRVYNRFQLLDKVWNMQFEVESNVVEVTIKNLRRKLADASSLLEIVSKRNIGYWIET
jgi:DNA-binding response OmpR family regulator